MSKPYEISGFFILEGIKGPKRGIPIFSFIEIFLFFEIILYIIADPCL
jgi:hypothetical protein